MEENSPTPGIERQDRISDQGLCRLEKQLSSGARMSPVVLKQWISRYGEQARSLIRRYGQYRSELDSD